MCPEPTTRATIDILALVFSGIRVYALAGRRMYLAFIVFILNATFIIPDIVSGL